MAVRAQDQDRPAKPPGSQGSSPGFLTGLADWRSWHPRAVNLPNLLYTLAGTGQPLERQARGLPGGGCTLGDAVYGTTKGMRAIPTVPLPGYHHSPS